MTWCQTGTFAQLQAIFFLPISIVIFFVEWSRGSRQAPPLTVSSSLAAVFAHSKLDPSDDPKKTDSCRGDAKAEHARRVEKVAASVKILGCHLYCIIEYSMDAWHVLRCENMQLRLVFSRFLLCISLVNNTFSWSKLFESLRIQWLGNLFWGGAKEPSTGGCSTFHFKTRSRAY